MTDDAWKQFNDLWRSFTKHCKVRDDLRVTALGHDRTVRLVVGESPKFRPPGSPPPVTTYSEVQRNVSTMRKLGQALIEACDYVDSVNPTWAAQRDRCRAEQWSTGHRLDEEDEISWESM